MLGIVEVSRELRRAIVSVVIVLTFAACTLITLPIAQRYSTARLQDHAKTAKPNEMAGVRDQQHLSESGGDLLLATCGDRRRLCDRKEAAT